MRVEDVAEMVEQIKKRDGDNEVQHSLEDDLMVEVLRAIADGAVNGNNILSKIDGHGHTGDAVTGQRNKASLNRDTMI